MYNFSSKNIMNFKQVIIEEVKNELDNKKKEIEETEFKKCFYIIKGGDIKNKEDAIFFTIDENKNPCCIGPLFFKDNNL